MSGSSSPWWTNGLVGDPTVYFGPDEGLSEHWVGVGGAADAERTVAEDATIEECDIVRGAVNVAVGE